MFVHVQKASGVNILSWVSYEEIFKKECIWVSLLNKIVKFSNDVRIQFLLLLCFYLLTFNFHFL